MGIRISLNTPKKKSQKKKGGKTGHDTVPVLLDSPYYNIKSPQKKNNSNNKRKRRTTQAKYSQP